VSSRVRARYVRRSSIQRNLDDDVFINLILLIIDRKINK